MRTERTPLLNPAPSPPAPQLPSFSSTISRLASWPAHLITLGEILPSYSDSTTTAEAAFIVAVLLELRVKKLRETSFADDVWDKFYHEPDLSRDIDDLEGKIKHVWSRYLEVYHSPDDIQAFFWQPFHIDNYGYTTVRIISYLCRTDAPIGLSTHRVVELQLQDTWKRGVSSSVESSPILLRHFYSLCTPRALHIVELAFELWYLLTLANYLLYPPTIPIITTDLRLYGFRELLLLIFSLASLARPWTLRVIPFLLVLAAFTSCLPSLPVAKDVSFDVLLLALFIHIYQLHLPRTASPLFLPPVELSLPLAVFLHRGTMKIILPATLFFLPILLVSWFLLSLSLADWPLPLAVSLAAPSFPGTLTPMDTRNALLALFSTAFLLLLCSFFLLATAGAPLTSSSGWDRYDGQVGLEARRTFARAVIHYASPCYTPPPFTLLRVVLLPALGLRALGVPSSSPAYVHITTVYSSIWRVTVGLIAALCGTILRALRC